MYTNMQTEHALEILELWIDKLYTEGKINDLFPRDLVLQLTELIMKNNFFEFGDTYWLQLEGCAMGTPMATTYATLYFAWKELYLVPMFSDELALLKRYIDDIYGIWLVGTGPRWEEFKLELNKFGNNTLEWEGSKTGLSDEEIILDLRINILIDGTIKYRTYQKDMNTYQYVVKHSAHPDGGLRSLCLSSLSTYWDQNTLRSDYQNYALRLLQRLTRRGYLHEDIKPHFIEAAQRIDTSTLEPPVTTITTSKRKTLSKDTEIFHVEHHPEGLPNTTIKCCFYLTCNFGEEININTNMLDCTSEIASRIENGGGKHQPHLYINRLLIARSRPTNLMDLLTPSTLHTAQDKNVSTFLPTLVHTSDI